jgi:Ca-activated chloride channel homolog
MPSPTRDGPRRRTLLLASGAAALLAGGGAPLRAQAPVDLALVLLVDASGSISDGGWTFQLRGHATAFRDPRLAAAIEAGATGRIAVTLAAFAGPRSLRRLVPWSVIGPSGTTEAFADRIEASPVDGRGGATAIGSAIEGAIDLFDDAPASARRTIDISANGFSNAGIDPEVARDRAVAAGVTINALVIVDEYDWLEAYFADAVIGGPGAFVKTAEDRESFAEAIFQKLLAEIAAVPERNRSPYSGHG